MLLQGFDNKLFRYHGAKWSWTVLLGSAPMGWRIRALVSEHTGVIPGGFALPAASAVGSRQVFRQPFRQRMHG